MHPSWTVTESWLFCSTKTPGVDSWIVTSFSSCDAPNSVTESKLLSPLAMTAWFSDILTISCRGHGKVFSARVFWKLVIDSVPESLMPRTG